MSSSGRREVKRETAEQRELAWPERNRTEQNMSRSVSLLALYVCSFSYSNVIKDFSSLSHSSTQPVLRRARAKQLCKLKRTTKTVQANVSSFQASSTAFPSSHHFTSTPTAFPASSKLLNASSISSDLTTTSLSTTFCRLVVTPSVNILVNSSISFKGSCSFQASGKLTVRRRRVEEVGSALRKRGKS